MQDTDFHGDTAFDAELDAVVNEIAGEWETALVDDELDALGGADESAEPDTELAATDEGDPVDDPDAAPSEPDPSVARGLDRLVQREVEIRSLEAQVKSEREQLTTLRAQLEEQQKRLQSGGQDLADLTAIREKAKYDPAGALKALGLDPSDTVKLILAEQMGDKAPPELRQALREQKRDREIAELREQIAAKDRQAAAAEFYQGIATSVQTYVTAGISEKDAPSVAVVAKTNPELVRTELLEEIARDTAEAQRSGRRLIDAKEAAVRLEKRWAAIRGAAVQTAQPTGKQEPPGKIAGAGAPTTRPKTARPIKPWESKEHTDLEDAGLRAALQEYKRVESTKRK